MSSIAGKYKDAKYFRVSLATPWQHIFLTAVWISHSQLWAILERTDLLTGCLSPRFP